MGAVLKGHFGVQERCDHCGLRFHRGGTAYFSGAVIVNYLLSSAATLATFLVVVALTWPGVPWRVLGYSVPALVVAMILLLHPVAKVILLTVDVRFRAVTPDEFA